MKMAYLALSVVAATVLPAANVYEPGSGMRASVQSFLRAAGYKQVAIEYAVVPCGRGPVWSGDMRPVGFQLYADQGDEEGRGRRHFWGHVCNDGFSSQWSVHSWRAQCFDYDTGRWVDAELSTSCPVMKTQKAPGGLDQRLSNVSDRIGLGPPE